ncbi:alkylated DNA repair protein alkb homolog 8 [Plakobranchus ocellatus]|uniref:tRNA (carboxymethyluridine(34)-5-O)-methyltransferase n=1 Tax=Plakobranchus ocellatus TaxID=259542 RepID=A0AAV4APD4_9GAST|nr:alkylated DNA repair protein alkb homolog 8 [Plakobranchus ocellatus]
MAASEGKAHVESKQWRKKFAKKLVKIEKSLAEKENVIITKEKTQILCVQNGGLGNGVSQAELLPLFSQFGNLESIVMLPHKQFCFACFTNIESAAQAQMKLNGFLLKTGSDPTQDVILYLGFVEKAPSNIAPSDEKPAGLVIVEEFVSEAMEKTLIDLMDLETDDKYEDPTVMKHRKVKHFGFEFKYSINDVDIKDPLPKGIPDICHEFLQKALERGLINHFPDQLTINSYQPGQGIPPHVDTREAFEDGIVSLSLGSSIVMDFSHPDGRHVSVLLPRRSLMVMNGESRYVWSHGITPRKSDIVPVQTSHAIRSACDLSYHGGSSYQDSNTSNNIDVSSCEGLTLRARGRRVSYTFRKVVMDRLHMCKAACKTSGREGSALEDATVPQTDSEAVALERKHVNKVYEDIAEHFSGTRYKPWPKVVDFILEQPPMSLLADVGCGNGKCLGHNKTLFEIGSDFSSNLASICHSRGFETCVGDVTCLPFRTGSFDVVLCIAVIHHMATKNRRAKALSEVVRILRKGGKALVYVWAMEQELHKTQSKYIKPGRQQKQDAIGNEGILNSALTFDMKQGPSRLGHLASCQGFSGTQTKNSRLDNSNLNPGSVSSNLNPGSDSSNLNPGPDSSNLNPGSDSSNLNPGSDSSNLNAGSDSSNLSPGPDSSNHNLESDSNNPNCESDRNNPDPKSGSCDPHSLESNFKPKPNLFGEKNTEKGYLQSSSASADALSSTTVASELDLARQISVGHSESDYFLGSKSCVKEKKTSDTNSVSDIHNKPSESSLKKLSVHVNRTQFKDQDLLVPWQLKGKHGGKAKHESSSEGMKGDLFHRFYHVFRQGEIEAICKKVPGCAVRKSYYDQGNCEIVQAVKRKGQISPRDISAQIKMNNEVIHTNRPSVKQTTPQTISSQQGGKPDSNDQQLLCD